LVSGDQLTEASTSASFAIHPSCEAVPLVSQVSTSLFQARATPGPKIAILLCTFQGGSHLEEQLKSYITQTHQNWNLHVSDDGSSDDTLAILRRYKEFLGADKVSIKEGPNQGFASNFLSLTVCTSNLADYYAYSDQDDVWEADKLERAVAWLQTIAPKVPALYCSRTRIIDHQGRSVGLSPLFREPPSFANALVQNIGGGNTMVFNETARKLIAESLLGKQMVSHDWWAYIVITAFGGKLYYDTYPSVRYRQHSTNLIGSNNSLYARLFRIRMLVNGRLKNWSDCNIAALQPLEHLITAENRQTLRLFVKARNNKYAFKRLLMLKRSGVRRQNLISQLSLFIASLVGKL
jgi:glycosyltransferase involved in cell wall biosynthesis